MATPETPLTLAAIARPGDTVIIGFARPLSDDEVGWMEESFRPMIDRGIQVAFADQVASIVVARPLTSDVVDEEFRDWGEG